MAGLTREQRAAREAAAQNRDEDHDDERIVRSSGMEVRGDRGSEQDPARIDPTDKDDFEKLIEAEFESSSLPNPPEIPGWHLCWLTSNSQWDSIQKRQRLGYQPVRLSEMPDFDPSNGQKLERFEGFVTCNEMVLFKIPEQKYQALMNYFHHKKPMEQEEGILAVMQAGAGKDSSGKNLAQIEGDGLGEMANRVKKDRNAAPTFS